MRFLAALFCALFIGVSAPPAEADSATRNLQVFAKLFGYVRYFHPSDEAAAVDWERFAIHGAKAVASAKTSAELRGELEKLFLPIAPSVQLFGEQEKPRNVEVLRGDDLQLVAWQHVGVGLGNPGPYRSARLNRKSAGPVSGAPFGGIVQMVDAAPLRGKDIRLSARGKAAVAGAGNQLQFWLRVDRAERKPGFFDNMGSRPIRANAWKAYAITGSVADDAEKIAFGAFLAGTGTAVVDNFRLEAREPGGTWTDVAIKNPTFEADNEGALPSGWFAAAPGYRFSVRAGDAGEGKHSLLIERNAKLAAARLFDRHPSAGEFVDVLLGAGLHARIPLALQSRNGKTLPHADAAALAALQKRVAAVHPEAVTAADPAVRQAGVIIAWNVLQHFYPYFDVVETDWDAVLTDPLRRATADTTVAQFGDTLRSMVAELRDGHGAVAIGSAAAEQAGLPFLVEWVEGKAVVIAVANGTSLQVGDVITSIDDETSEGVLARIAAKQSGSPQWKRAMAGRQFGVGQRGSTARVAVERAGERLSLEAGRTSAERLDPQRPANFAEVAPGVRYVDLSSAEMSAIEPRLGELAAARAIVFDLRGYPKNNHDILRHLTSEPLQSARWQVPQVIYPDRHRLVGYDENGRWTLEPKAPRLRGKIIFLTGGGAISYAESVMGIVEHYKLGTIVGSRTAGANGNVNAISLPGGFRIFFTGMRVLKHDGSQHHLVGIAPHVMVEPTIAGIRAGRDEVLERALEVARR